LRGEGLFPEVAVVVFGEGGALHGDGFDPIDLMELHQIPAKVIECLTWISFAGIHSFIMESDLMALRH
jgi:hypothetical protein